MEDIDHFLDLWDSYPDKPFHKILTAHSKKGIHRFLCKSQEELSKLSCLDESGISYSLEPYEMRAIRMTRRFMSNLNEKEELNSSLIIFRFTSITRDD